MRESCTYGSVRGASSNGGPYRNREPKSSQQPTAKPKLRLVHPAPAAPGDPVLAMMRDYGIPMTREKYLRLAYMGDPPEELGPEEEANLPPQFQNWDRFSQGS
jgi:hypothetical protein